MNKKITTIFMDLGDTFRVLEKDADYIYAAKARMAELLGVTEDPEKFHREVIETRYDRYREWVLKWYCEAPVKVLWTRWLAYDFPRDLVEANAEELTYLYRLCKGRRVITEGGVETVKELCRRGYTMGIISDLVGTVEVDEWLDRDQLRPYFKTVQQSSVTMIRKPHPAIYYYALNEVGVDAEECAYVGDNLERDIIGAKATGFGMTVGVRYANSSKKPQPITEENRPDAFITHFTQLLDLFPPLKQEDEHV